MAKKISVLFVCLGNICRSPTAHGIFRHKVKQQNLQQWIDVDSAGTAAYHIGEAPDLRSIKAAANRGIKIQDLRARQVLHKDFAEFDYILAMDHKNLAVLEKMKSRTSNRAHVALLLDYVPTCSITDVPDPYYGGPSGFEQVLDLVDAACDALLNEIIQSHEFIG